MDGLALLVEWKVLKSCDAEFTNIFELDVDAIVTQTNVRYVKIVNVSNKADEADGPDPGRPRGHGHQSGQKPQKERYRE